MNRLPTLRQLDQLGTDARAVLDMKELDLELAVDNACTPRGRANVQAALRRLHKRRAEHFSDDV